jgi:V/A-type H+-transporting ATPase subunit E
MTGLDKILSRIKAEAESRANEKIEQARQQAEAIIRDMKDRGKAESDRLIQQSSSDAANIITRAESAAALQKRKAILSAKLQMIDEVIQKAKDTILNLQQEEYFNLMLKIASRYSLPQNGKIVFSQKDLSRLPADFEKTLNGTISQKGGFLEVSKETRSIDGGFILIYGDIEENCSIEALFNDRRDTLQDKVHELLFS